MTSTYPIGTLGSVASLLAAILYQGNTCCLFCFALGSVASLLAAILYQGNTCCLFCFVTRC